MIIWIWKMVKGQHEDFTDKRFSRSPRGTQGFENWEHYRKQRQRGYLLLNLDFSLSRHILEFQNHFKLLSI